MQRQHSRLQIRRRAHERGEPIRRRHRAATSVSITSATATSPSQSKLQEFRAGRGGAITPTLMIFWRSFDATATWYHPRFLNPKERGHRHGHPAGAPACEWQHSVEWPDHPRGPGGGRPRAEDSVKIAVELSCRAIRRFVSAVLTNNGGLNEWMRIGSAGSVNIGRRKQRNLERLYLRRTSGHGAFGN